MRARILVIEDYQDSRRMLKLILESLDYEVVTARNGNEGLSLATKMPVDLILTDLGLPDLDGIGVVRRLREIDDRYRSIPIIMQTAIDRAECYEAARDAGCTEVLSKPIDFNTLEALIDKLLTDRRDGRQDTAVEVVSHES
jgi:CheY-like chemotaxis protein